MEGVRPAGAADVATCAALLAAARRDLASHRGGALLDRAVWGEAPPDEGPALAAVVARWIADPHRLVVVGEFDGTPVGVAVAHLERPGADGTPVGVLDACYVDPAARGVGVGTALVEAVVAWCTSEGCRTIDAPALPGDRETKQRLEAAGFSARLLVLHRRVP